jgi:hypothetical protein
MKYNFLIAVLAVSFFAMSSCKDDEEKCSTEWATETADESTAFSNAAQAYALNPTTATCNTYKTTAHDYVDALKEFEDCADLTGTTRQQWEAALASWETQLAAIDTIDCTNLGTNTCPWQSGTSDELIAVGNAKAAFNQDSTVTTCTNFKSSAQAYANALATYDACVTASERAQFDTAVSQAQSYIAEINTVDCSSLGTGGCNWASETQDELTQMAAAGNTYGQNPSTANCNAYKNSIQAYINALDLFDSCTQGEPDRGDWENTRNGAQASYDGLTC